MNRGAEDQDVTALVRDDARARAILFGTYWTSAGWVHEPPAIDDFAYAKSAGYMFEPRAGRHDDWVELAINAAGRVTLADAAAAFVGSLSKRRLADRSALGSLAAARHLESHSYRLWSASCAECGLDDSGRPEDLNVLSFERHKWGGVRHGNPVYAWFDLDVFRRSERAPETPEDVAILNNLLDAARQAPAEARARDLERAIARMVPSSKPERDIMLGLLAMAGVLAPADHPGLLTAWVPYSERQPPPRPSKNDWLYPMFWWRGSDGVNEVVAREVFGSRVK